MAQQLGASELEGTQSPHESARAGPLGPRGDGKTVADVLSEKRSHTEGGAPRKPRKRRKPVLSSCASSTEHGTARAVECRALKPFREHLLSRICLLTTSFAQTRCRSLRPFDTRPPQERQTQRWRLLKLHKAQ